MDADGSRVRRLTRTVHERDNWRANYEPAWSPDGRRIAFVRLAFQRGESRADLSVVDVDGRGARQLTRTPPPSPTRLGRETTGSPSPAAVTSTSSAPTAGASDCSHAAERCRPGHPTVRHRFRRERCGGRRRPDADPRHARRVAGLGVGLLLARLREDSQPLRRRFERRRADVDHAPALASQRSRRFLAFARPLAHWLATARQRGRTDASASTIARWLAEYPLKPWQYRSWVFPTDPDFPPKRAPCSTSTGQVGGEAAPPRRLRCLRRREP